MAIADLGLPGVESTGFCGSTSFRLTNELTRAVFVCRGASAASSSIIMSSDILDDANSSYRLGISYLFVAAAAHFFAKRKKLVRARALRRGPYLSKERAIWTSEYRDL